MDNTALITTVINLVREQYGTPDLGNKSDPLDEIIYLVLCKQVQPGQLDRAFNRLKTKFENWDQVRIADKDIITNCLYDIGNSNFRTEQITSLLEYIYISNGSLDLNFLSSLSDEEAFKWLDNLPNVGPKIAQCVMLFSLKRDVFPVDVHIARIFKRIGIVKPELKPATISKQI